MNIKERMTLELKVSSPNFSLIDIYNREVSLEKYHGRKVLIGFFRHAGCPFCNLRTHFLQKEHEQLAALGLDMIFFFESRKDVMLRSTFHQGISPIPLVADPEKVWYESYGIEESAKKSRASHLTDFIQTAIRAKLKRLPLHLMAGKESFNTIPAEFLLDEQGVIRKIHYSNGLNDRMSIEHIYKFAKS